MVSGIAEGCRQAGCALIGGETAEMPGFYPVDEYDMAGFSVGMVDKEKMIDGTTIKPGDALIGVASSGVHSNGYSLVRKTLGINEKSVRRYIDEFGKSLGEELLTPTKIYVKAIQSLIGKVDVKGISHITGGGFYENVPRMLPEGIDREASRRRPHSGSAGIRPDRKDRQDPGARYVQYVQHGRRSGAGCRSRGRFPCGRSDLRCGRDGVRHRRVHCRRRKGRRAGITGENGRFAARFPSKRARLCENSGEYK